MDFYSEIEVYMKDICTYYPKAGQLKNPKQTINLMRSVYNAEK